MCLLFLLLFCLTINLKANSPIIIPNFPQSGQENIAVNSKISFHTNYEIDTSSLIHLSPIQNFYINDTVFVEKKYAQIMLIRKEYYQNVPDSLHYIYATEGSITTNSDNITINFNIHSLLDYETEYTLVVKDLFVIKPDTTQPSGYDTLAIDTTIVDFFKTTEVPIQLVSTSIDDREYQVLAGENLELLFSKKFLSSDLTNHNIATLAKVIDTVYVDSVNYYYVLDTVSTQRTLALDSTKIILNPDSLLELGKSYILSVDLKNVYGEYQPFFKEFWVKNYAKITLITRASYYDPDTNVVTDLFGSVSYEPDFDNAPLRDTVDNSFMGIVESQDVIYYPGTEFLARVPVTTPNNFYFVGFECPEDTTLNANYEDNTISVALTNTNLMDRTIIAKYKLAEDLQIELPFNVMIYGNHNVVRTKDSTIVYSFKNLPNREVTILPQFTSGLPFLEWTSNDPEYDGSAVACLSIPSSPKFDLGPYTTTPWKRDFKPNWDDWHMACNGARYKVEIKYINNIECFSYNYGSLTEPLPQGTYPDDIISHFYVKKVNDTTVNEQVNIVPNGTEYYGISSEYTGTDRLEKIIQFEIKEEYKDIYEISYVECLTNGIKEGSPDNQYFYDSELNGESWEHEIENKNLEGYPSGFSRNCMETVIVHIRRKLQKLTIEREMSDGSHVPTNLITFQLRNSDDTAPVGYIEYKNPEKVTVYYLDGRGKEIRKFTTFYAIPSGVSIRIVPECKENSGYSLDEWNCDDDYTCTDVLPTYEKPGDDPQSRELVLSTTMNQDRTVCLRVDAGFRLERVGFDEYVKENENINLVTTYLRSLPVEDIDGEINAHTHFFPNNSFNNASFDLAWNNISDVYKPNQYHNRACRIELLFNDEVNQASLEQGFFVEDNPRNEIRRYDGINKQIYRCKFQDNENQIYGVNYNARFLNDAHTIVEFLIINVEGEKKWAPHMQSLVFHFNGDIIKSQSNIKLSNATSNSGIERTTVLPGLKVTAVSFYNHFGSEIDAYVFNSVSLQNKGETINYTGYQVNKDGTYSFGVDAKKFPLQSDYYYMVNDSYWGVNHEIFLTNKLSSTNKLHLYFQMMDKNGFGLSLSQALNLAIKLGTTIATGGLDFKTFFAISGIINDATSDKDVFKRDDLMVGYTGFLLEKNSFSFIDCYEHWFGWGAGEKQVKENIGENTILWGTKKLYEPRYIESSYYLRSPHQSLTCDCRGWGKPFSVKIYVELGDFYD